MISIVTSTIGRELYLSRLLSSMESLAGAEDFEWTIVFQKLPPSISMDKKLKESKLASKIRIKHQPVIVPITLVIESTKHQSKFPIFMKLDDDALVCSPDFIKRCAEISYLVPKTIFYPLEVGGYANIQADPSTRQVIYGPQSNVFFSISHALTPRGLASIYPTDFVKANQLPHGQIDAQVLWLHAKRHNFALFQLQNSIIVEHQEGIEGQHYREQMPKGQEIQ